MSVQTEMLEIREYDKAMIEKCYCIEKRVNSLNEYFDEWCFTVNPSKPKIIAYRIQDAFGKAIEV